MFASIDPGESLLLRVLIQLMVIIAAARLGGWMMRRIGQPVVVGEIAAGLILGTSGLGRLSPAALQQLFPPETQSIFLVLGQLGLIFLMFIVGLEFDFGHLKQCGRTAGYVAGAGIVVPFVLGAALATWLHHELAPDYDRAGFVLFVATALSITAIPILGRIMMEFGISRTPLGVLTISAAAIDDALGWILLAVVNAVVRGQLQLMPVLWMLGLTAGFVILTFTVVLPLCRSAWAGYSARRGPDLSLGPFSVILLAVLGSAVITNMIGVFSIFGPFVLGAALSGQHELKVQIRRRCEEFVVAFFLPVFFTYTGLRVDIGTLSSGFHWALCGLLIVTAIVGKVTGCGLAARLGGCSWRDSAAVAVMMNTRALMGLIAINIGRDLGVIPDSIFCMMVIMAVVTTVMTAPILRRLIVLPDAADPAADRRV